jgi:hypothetical protein
MTGDWCCAEGGSQPTTNDDFTGVPEGEVPADSLINMGMFELVLNQGTEKVRDDTRRSLLRGPDSARSLILLIIEQGSEEVNLHHRVAMIAFPLHYEYGPVEGELQLGKFSGMGPSCPAQTGDRC